MGQRWGRIEREEGESWVRLRDDDEHGRELNVGTYVEARGAKVATLYDRSEPVMTRKDLRAYQDKLRAEGKQIRRAPEDLQGQWKGSFEDFKGQRWGKIERDEVQHLVRLEDDHQGRTLEPDTPVHLCKEDELTITRQPDRTEPSKSHLDVRAHREHDLSPAPSSPERAKTRSRMRSGPKAGPAAGDERSPTQRARPSARGEPPAPEHRPSVKEWLEDQKDEVRHLEPGVRTEGRVSKEPVYVKEGRYYTLETEENQRFLLKGNVWLDKQRDERVSVICDQDGYALVRGLDRDRDR